MLIESSPLVPLSVSTPLASSANGGVDVACAGVKARFTFSVETVTLPYVCVPPSAPPRPYTVYGLGGALGGTQTYGNVTVSTENVKRAFTPAQATSTPPFALLANGVLTLNGTSGDDSMSISSTGLIYTVT